MNSHRTSIADTADTALVGRQRERGVTPGVTLVELLVVLVLLGLLSGVVGLTLGSTPRVAALDPVTVVVLAARDSALRSGHPVTISVAVEGSARRATAFPDGRVLTDASLDIDALSGSLRTESVGARGVTGAGTIGNATR